MKRFIDCVIPFRTCNLRCHYCYITHTKSFGQKLPVFPYDAEHIGRALSRKRLGGVSLINLCGEGETLLPPEVVGIVQAILKQGHYVMVVTNGTISKRFDELAALPPDGLARLLVKFSYHYLELKKRNGLDSFFANVQKMRQAGASVSVELTPSDEMIPCIAEAIELCQAKAGAVCHLTVARDERRSDLAILSDHPRDEYRSIWSRFDSELFRFKLGVFGEKRTEFCYAGAWSATLDLVTGELRQCYRGERLQNIYQDPDAPIRFRPVGCHCPEPHCYNAHAFLTLGVIPELKTPTFADLRNRICADGSEWLTPGFKAFIGKKLGDENRTWSRGARMWFECGRRWRHSWLGRQVRKLTLPFHGRMQRGP